MFKRSALVAASLLAFIAPASVQAQSCKDVPRLTRQINAGVEKLSADAPTQLSMRQFGGICPTGRAVHGALNMLLVSLSKDPNHCGAKPEDVAKLRRLKEHLDIHSDCGSPTY